MGKEVLQLSLTPCGHWQKSGQSWALCPAKVNASSVCRLRPLGTGLLASSWESKQCPTHRGHFSRGSTMMYRDSRKAYEFWPPSW